MKNLDLLLTTRKYILFSVCEIKLAISPYDAHYFYHI